MGPWLALRFQMRRGATERALLPMTVSYTLKCSGTKPVLNSVVAFPVSRPYSHSRKIGHTQTVVKAGDTQWKPEQPAAPGLLSLIPNKLVPYGELMRIDKPIGTFLLMWPCWWSTAMASDAGCWPDPKLLTTFAVGSLVMRGAGCTINDLWDRDIDPKVGRTSLRPLARQAVTPNQAIGFLGVQLAAGLAVLLSLNEYTIILGASSLGLVALYPLAKRVTYWPQFVLGLTFNWGALVGWSAVTGSLNPSVCLPLYAAGVCWTLIYDTIYAHQDKDDDQLIGVKSTALRFGENTWKWLSMFSVANVSFLSLAGMNAEMSWPYFAFVGLGAGHLARQVYTLDIHCGDKCGEQFRSNKEYGLLIFLGAVAGKVW